MIIIRFGKKFKILLNSYNSLWCCFGDFNAIMFPLIKECGLSLPDHEFWEFKNLINHCGLIDLGYSGPAYTWFNQRQTQFLIREKLNRAFADSRWRQKFPEANITHLPTINSDHNPILLNLEKAEKFRKRRSFKFETMWLTK